ncbi:MAG: hypothetical protein V1797_14655 [Pseudomonadota bacterium]
MNTVGYRSQDFTEIYQAEILRTHRRDLRNRWWFAGMLGLFLALCLAWPGYRRYAPVLATVSGLVLVYNLWVARVLRRGLPPAWFDYLTTTIDMLAVMVYQLAIAYAYSPFHLASSPALIIYPYILFHVAHRLNYRLLIYALILTMICFNLPFWLTYPEITPAELATVPTAGPMGQVIKSVLLLGLGLHYLLIPMDTMKMLSKQEVAFQTRRMLAENYQRELEREVDAQTKVLSLANQELQKALDDVRTLRGLLPICSRCKKIRDENGQWQNMETYISSRTPASITHGLCQDCLRLLYPDISAEVLAEAERLKDRS